MITVVFVSLLFCVVPINLEAMNKSCKYTDPFSNGEFILNFTNQPEFVYYNNSEQRRMFIDSSTSSIKKFYVGKISNYTLQVDGSFSYEGKNWIFDEDMLDYSVNSSDKCPDIKYFTIKDKNDKKYVVITRGTSNNCSRFKCTNFESHDVYEDSEVDKCSISFTLPRNGSDKTFKFTSYSDGVITWIANDGNKGTVDPKNGLKYNAIPNNPLSLSISISSEDFPQIVSVDENKKINCLSGVVCVDQYDETMGIYSFKIRPMSYKNTNGCKIYNNINIDTGGNGSNPDSSVGGSNITKPGTNVNSSCSAYLGVAGAGDNIASFLDNIWGIIKVGSILLLIVFSMFDFSKAVTNDKEKIPEVVKKSVLRLFFLVAILLLPTIIDALGHLAGVDNVLCGIK